MSKRLKIALLVLVPLLMLVVGTILAQTAEAATTLGASESATSLFGLLPTSVAIGFVASYFIPWVSALVSHADTTWTGVVVVGLSFADGFFADWAANTDHFNWKAALGASLLAWAIAATSHSKVAKGGSVYNSLLSFGSTTSRTTVQT